MTLPELDVARVQRWYAVRVPEHARNHVRIECEVSPRQLTIVERRARASYLRAMCASGLPMVARSSL